MSELLSVLQSDTASKFAWSGRLALLELAPPIADPILLTWNDHASIVLCVGALNQAAALKMALLVLREARKPETRLVYLVLAVQAGRLGAMSIVAATLREAGQHAAVIAYLQEVAFGPALWIAYQCGLVFSNPATQIGWLTCFSEEGESDVCATLGMVDDLAALNPRVPRSTWARLVRASMTGEAAEACGIIDQGSLKRDVFKLSGIDPYQWPKQ